MVNGYATNYGYATSLPTNGLPNDVKEALKKKFTLFPSLTEC